MITDQLLLTRAQKGDADAFTQLIEPLEKQIYAVALRMMGSRESAEDAAQEAILRIYKNIKSFKASAALSTWAYRVTTNVCLDELRKQKSRAAESLNDLLESGFEPLSGEQPPEEAALQREKLQEIGRAIRRLTPEQRAVILLRDVQGLSYEEVAAALSENLNTVKSRIARARAALRDMLAGQSKLFNQTNV